MEEGDPMINLLMVIAAIFIMGAVVGLVAVVSIGIRHEERPQGPYFQGGKASGLWRTTMSTNLAPALAGLRRPVTVLPRDPEP
jgi:heme/copper-type cytochrome/quinol oxidase subunit 2